MVVDVQKDLFFLKHLSAAPPESFFSVKLRELDVHNLGGHFLSEGTVTEICFSTGHGLSAIPT